MALLRKINTKAKTEINSGFGTNAADYGGRLVNKDGMPNVEKTGVGFFEKISWYHTMLQLPRWKFFTTVLLFYVLINFIFAFIYLAIGIQYLVGMNPLTSLEKFGEAYFFSAQTFTTVGYGRISPVGFAASAVSSLEALTGLLSFALATGLFYGRFSKPKAYLRFSTNAILAPFKDGIAIMMRVAPYKNTTLVDAEAKVSAAIMVEDNNGKLNNTFFPLELEYDKVNALTLSWTLVHPINENSPFYKFSLEDFAATRGEIIVYLKAFDDMFSNTVVSRSSYTLKEMVIGAKFVMMYQRDDKRNKTVLNLEKLNTYTKADISYAFAAEKNIVNG
jgi:inward rectifier potassium channel